MSAPSISRVFSASRHQRVAALLAAIGAAGVLGACGSTPTGAHPACYRGGPMPVTSYEKRGFTQGGCGHSKCSSPDYPHDPVPLAGTDCDDATAALLRLESLLYNRREFRYLFEYVVVYGKGWEVEVNRRDLAAVRAIALADPLVHQYVYSDR